MRALADDHHLVAHAARPQPLAEHAPRCGRCRRSRRCRRRCRRARRRRRAGSAALAKSGKSSKPSASTRRRLARGRASGRRGIASAGRSSGRFAQRARPRLRPLDAVDEPGVGPPLVEHAQVAERVVPGHARGRELLPAGADRLAPPRRPRRSRASACSATSTVRGCRRGGSPRCGRRRPRGREANQKSATSIRPSVPSTRSTFSCCERDRAGDLGDDAVRELRAAPTPTRRRPVSPRCATPATFDRIEERLARRRPGDQPRHRHRVAADVEDAAAGELVGVEPVRRDRTSAWRSRSST